MHTFEGYPYMYSPGYCGPWGKGRFCWTYNKSLPYDRVFYTDEEMFAWENRLNKVAGSMLIQQHPDYEWLEEAA